MAELGHEVLGVDTDTLKIAALSEGGAPFFEPGLTEILIGNIRSGKLRFSTSLTDAARFADVHFICVGTPQLPGSLGADLSSIEAVLDGLAPDLAHDCLVVGKSTVPVGTAPRLAARLAGLAPDGITADLAWNPEFLREGFAVQDTLCPDRLVAGVTSPRADTTLRAVYAPLVQRGTPYITTDLATAELAKVAANAFLATKISFINAVADVCDAAGADVVTLADILGHDDRIGRRFLFAGLGFGGGCLPKDIRAFLARAGELGVPDSVRLLHEVDQINNGRRRRAVDLVRNLVGGSFAHRNVAVLGAAFKPGTDDVRDSPALSVAAAIRAEGAAVRVHDPQAADNARQVCPELDYCDEPDKTCEGADVVLHLTEWSQYRELEPARLRSVVRAPRIFDGRNVLPLGQWRAAGWTVRSMGAFCTVPPATKDLPVTTIPPGLSRRAITLLVALSAAIFLASCTRAAQATGPLTYYLSPSGDDAAAGTSPASAWRTLGHASSVSLRPGTRLLLQGGRQFSGQLTLGQRDAGDAAHPVVVGSYGSGTATIVSGTGSGIYVHDTAGVDISGLSVTGQPPAAENGAGIDLYNDLPAHHMLGHVAIDHVIVSGFASGISFGGQNSAAGFSNVAVSNSILSRNLDAGLISYGPGFDATSPAYANQDINVSHVEAAQNYGDPHVTSHNTGNGIVLGSVRYGIISQSTADYNGGAGGATEGPAGIWAYDSTHVVIEHNLSYAEKTANRVDGNGFGFDQNTSDSYLQYNLSYGNDGAGYLVYSGQNNGAQRDNAVRYNISSADSRDGNSFYGGISVIGLVKDIGIYQNTVVMTPAPGGSPAALRLGPPIQNISVRNNVFMTEGGPIVAAARALPPAAATLQGNDYFSATGPWSLDWGPMSYTSLPAWRAASSQEIVAGRLSGFAVDPQLVGPVLGLQAKLASQTTAGDGFALRPGSPLAGAGLDLASLFGLGPASLDYSGKAAPSQHPNVGAQ
jgi:UDPglucose 6-dehydrogenase